MCNDDKNFEKPASNVENANTHDMTSNPTTLLNFRSIKNSL